jgi:pimeloyl-ACP methyl ester carboxylesterase
MSASGLQIDGGIEHGFAQLSEVKLHFAKRGNGERFVVLLHGFPECWYSWRHQLKALSDEYTVVAPDMRGYNLSDKPPRVEDYTIDHLVTDVVDLIEYFGAKEAAVVGHDWGAGVAWAVASRRPETIWKLAVLQVPHPLAWKENMSLAQLFKSWYMFFFQLPRLPEKLFARRNFEVIDKSFREMIGRPGSFTDEDIEVYKNAFRQPAAITAAINYYRANIFARRKKQQGEGRINHRVKSPTLFIYGEMDPFIVPRTTFGNDRFVDAPYSELRIPDAGHWVQNEAVEEVNRALLEFLRA